MLKLLKQKAKYLALVFLLLMLHWPQLTQVLDVKSKYFTAANYNKFSNEKLDLKIKQKGLVDKSDIARFINNFDFNKQVATLAT